MRRYIHIRHSNSVLSRDPVPLKVDFYKEEYEIDFILKHINMKTSSITASPHCKRKFHFFCHLLLCVRN